MKFKVMKLKVMMSKAMPGSGRNKSRISSRSPLPAMICLLCSGCGRAPSFDIIGSFFPVWMVCIAIGVVLAFVVRYFLLQAKLETEVGPLALFYPSTVILFTSLLWLIFFR